MFLQARLQGHIDRVKNPTWAGLTVGILEAHRLHTSVDVPGAGMHDYDASVRCPCQNYTTAAYPV